MTKKKIAFHIVIVILLCIPVALIFYACFAANDSPSYETQTVTVTEPRVYVTTYGDCYHSDGCSYLSKSQIPMGKQQAINNGYTACSRCGGHSDGAIEVTYTKRVPIEEDHSAKNIGKSIALSVVCTPLVYGIIFAIIALCRKQLQSSESSAATVPCSPPTPPIPKVSIRVGDAVHHKILGLGVVKKTEANRFTVRFDHEEKEFISPDVFDSGIMTKFTKKDEKQDV